MRGSLLGVIIAAGLLGGVALGADAKVAADQAKAWIRQLGADEYSQRNEAAQALMQAGRAALAPLREALEDEDPEISIRAAQLLLALRGRGFIGVDLHELNSDGTPVIPVQALRPKEAPDADMSDAGEHVEAPAKPVWIELVINLRRGQNLPGEKYGMQDGDKIVGVNGRRVDGSVDLMREVGLAGPGAKLLVELVREGRPVRVVVVLARHPDDTNVPVLINLDNEEGEDPDKT